jgi:hypothetical protein
LGSEPCSIAAHAVQLSGCGMRLAVNQPIPVDSAVSVRAGDWIAFGEVCYCEPEEEHYAVGVQLDQTVMCLQELEALMRNRLNERAPEPAVLH